MTDLFGDSTPIRVTLTFHLWPLGQRFDWDAMAVNPDTGDLLHLSASPARRRDSLGPELARALLLVQS
ncbi:MAG TPA: hypothetical protein VJ796_12575, partial [Acidimicrobiia bacterium]|nr:hypothetical protein [Acidimicrobiia bacterium]